VRKYILISALLVNGGALSQEAKPLTFTVTPQELSVMAQALGERPYREVAPLLNKLEAQLQEQRAKAAAESKQDQPDKPQ
jgi:hypothetical protein